MGSHAIQGQLWRKRSKDWASIQDKTTLNCYEYPLIFLLIVATCLTAFAQNEIRYFKSISADDFSDSNFINHSEEATTVFFKYEPKKSSGVASTYFGDAENNNYNWTISVEKKIRLAITDSIHRDGLIIKTHNKKISLKCVVYSLQDGKVKSAKMSKKSILEDDHSDTTYLNLSFKDFQKKSIVEIIYYYKSELLDNVISFNLNEVSQIKNSKIELTIPDYFQYRISFNEIVVSGVRKIEKEILESQTIEKMEGSSIDRLVLKKVKLSYTQYNLIYLINRIENKKGTVNLHIDKIRSVIVE